jgi:hypothetical protein
MNLGHLLRLYTEFENECQLRNIQPSFELFNLWAETTHRFFLATDNGLFEEFSAA